MEDPPGLDRSPLVRGIDALTDTAGLLSAAAVIGMMGIICYEVISRYVFNAPTYWVTEVATYVFVAIVFVGLAVAQRGGRHIQVEILVSRLDADRRRHFELVALWVAVVFVTFAAWQMGAFNFQEYVHDTRDWGLLSTPQWIPQLPVTLGYLLFVIAILRDIYRLAPPAAKLARWTVPIAALVLAGALIALGPRRVAIDGTPLDWGTIAICLAMLVAMFAWSGARVMLAVAAIYAAIALLFHFGGGISMLWTGILLIAALLGLLLIGIRVGVAMGVIGLLGLVFLLSRPQLAILADRSWTSVNSFTLTAIPMFVLMGTFLIRSGITTRLFDALVCWFGRTSGGLANASVGASAIFAAVSGSSLATAATLGQVAAPEMTRRGYSARLTYGVVAAGATLGILIPPSIAMIIYGNMVGVSISVLFMAGIVPGLMLAGLFMLTVLVWSMTIPDATPRGEPFPIRVKLASLVSVLPFLLLILAVLGSLYAGIATPTEAGAIGAGIAMLLCLAYGQLSLRALYECAIETVRVTAFLMLIVVGAAIFSWVFDFLRLPRAMVAFVTEAELAPWMVMLMIALVYVALGTIIESISMMVMTLAVTFPIVVALGLDPVWFGIVLVLLIEIGLVTPPVGIILFVLRGISGDVPLREIVLGVLPFVLIMLGFIVFLYLVPDVVMWLPNRMM